MKGLQNARGKVEKKIHFMRIINQLKRLVHNNKMRKTTKRSQKLTRATLKRPQRRNSLSNVLDKKRSVVSY